MAKSTKTLRITQTKSEIGYARDQHDTLRSLGLRHMGSVTEKPDTPSVQGMLQKVRHLVTVEEI
ncbi:MAG: 50S ribosomal protein L30 [Coriobacteriales bacterium]|nr:50S ribosomal protein L30 [Coriobacteriales bacterium]